MKRRLPPRASLPGLSRYRVRVGAEPLLDTSASIKLLVDEPGCEEARNAYTEADGIRTNSIAHVEATASLVRMRRGKRLSPAQLNRALDDLENIWRGIFSHTVDDSLLARAAESARTHSLQPYDAVHLGGALSFAAGEKLDFAC